jgi:DNA modification methylase
MKGGIKKDEWKQWVSGLWNIPSVRKNDDHPAKFPQELVERLVLMYSFPEDRILDPCLGSGTTAIVSKKLGRTPYGYEKNMSYKETILKNLKEVHNAEIN